MKTDRIKSLIIILLLVIILILIMQPNISEKSKITSLSHIASSLGKEIAHNIDRRIYFETNELENNILKGFEERKTHEILITILKKHKISGRNINLNKKQLSILRETIDNFYASNLCLISIEGKVCYQLIRDNAFVNIDISNDVFHDTELGKAIISELIDRSKTLSGIVFIEDRDLLRRTRIFYALGGVFDNNEKLKGYFVLQYYSSPIDADDSIYEKFFLHPYLNIYIAGQDCKYRIGSKGVTLSSCMSCQLTSKSVISLITNNNNYVETIFGFGENGEMSYITKLPLGYGFINSNWYCIVEIPIEKFE